MFDRDDWHGKELLNKIELFSFFFFYTIIIFIPMFLTRGADPEVSNEVIKWVFIGLGFYVLGFIALRQYIFRKIADKYNGMRIISGWMDQEEDMGEYYELHVAKIVPFEDFTEADKLSIQEFISLAKHGLEEFERVGRIEYSKQLDDRTSYLGKQPPLIEEKVKKKNEDS